MTTAKLSMLFDYQRFEKNARLQKVIDEAHRRIEARELTDDELDQVAAAGVLNAQTPKKSEDHPT
ncbi:MAG: hypothetical protein J6330_10190 [Clostridia bacterium]|nr:hypothetical protein [Clostridia bacterium]